MKKVLQKQELSIYYLLPLIFTFSIVPLIVLLRVIPLDDVSFQYWTGKKSNSDFFSYYKAMMLMILTGLSFISFYIAAYNKKIEIKPLKQYYIPLGAYAFFIILSSLLSKYPNTSRMGFVDRYEGAFVLLSYLLVTFFAITMFQGEKQLKIAMVLLFASAVVIGTIGIFQYFGLDIFKSQFGKELILTPQYQSDASTMEFSFGEYTIYSTLYNTNFVGSYMAMLFPISLGLYIFAKKRSVQIVTGIVSCLMLANLVGCRSRAGYLGGFIAALVLLLLLRKDLLKNIRKILIIVLCYVVIVAGMNAASGGSLIGRFVNTDTQTKNTTDINETTNQAPVQSVQLKDIKMSGKKVSIISASETLNLELTGNQVAFTDTDGKPLKISKDASGNITFIEKRYSAYSLQPVQGGYFQVKLGSMGFGLAVTQNGFKIVGERGILLDSIDHPEKVGFEGKEKLGSSRGYIWSRSIPILKRTTLVGYGPDTYAMAFPQHDYVGKLLAFDRTSEIVDKPHDLYLQIGINTGVISLLVFFALIVIYIGSCIKLYYKRAYQTFADFLGGAIFTAICGYLVAAVFNDSLVSVAPVFWALLGVGISCNYILMNKVPIKSEVNNKARSTNNKRDISVKKQGR